MPGVVDTLRYVLTLDDAGFKEKAIADDAAVNKLGGSFSGILAGGLAAAAAGFVALKAIDYAKDAALTAARTEVLGTVLHQVGAVAGESAGYLDDLTEKIKAQGITTQEARQVLIRFMQAELDLADAVKVARVAQDLAVISGQDSSQALNTIVEAVASLNTIQLRQFGLVKNLNIIYSEYAKTLGKGSDDLSEFEKRQSLVNEILSQGARVAGTYEAAMGDVGKQLTSMPRYVEEMKNAIGQGFLPLMTDIIKLLHDATTGITRFLSSGVDLKTSEFSKLQSELEKITGTLPDMIAEYEKLSSKTKLTNTEQNRLLTLQQQIAALAPDYIKALNDEGYALDLNAKSLENYIGLRKEQIEIIKVDLIKALLAEEEAQEKANRQNLLAIENFKKIAEENRKAGVKTDYGIPGQINQLVIELSKGIQRSLELQQRIRALGGEAQGAVKKVAETSRITAEEAKAFAEIINKQVFGNENFSRIEDQVHRIQSLIEGIDWQFGEEGLTPNTDKLIGALRSLINAEAGTLSVSAQKIITDALGKARMAAEKQRENERAFWDEELAHEADLYGVTARNIEQERELRVRAALDLSDALTYVATSFFDLFDRGIADIAYNLGNAISGAISGFSAGGVAGIASAIGSILNGAISLMSNSTDRMTDGFHGIEVSQYQLKKAIEELRRTFEDVTRAEKEEQKAGVLAVKGWITPYVLGGSDAERKRRAQEWTDYLNSLGLNVPQGLSLEDLQKWLDGWLADLDASNTRRETENKADNAQTRKDIVMGSKTGKEALDRIAELDELYGLTPEELHDLYEGVMEKYGKDISDSDWRWLQGEINRYHREEAKGKDSEQTQISRSIQKVTERQADSLISAASTIDLHMQEGFRTVVDAIGKITNQATLNAAATLEVAVINAGVINTGSIRVAGSITGAGGSSTNIKQLLIADTRALGKRV